MTRSNKRTIHFYNNSGSLDNTIEFLEKVQKKVDYINLNATVEGNSIEIVVSGPKDLQILACERIKALADEIL
ncbi:MAG: hypothetical protein ACOC44_17735 [Promethearchaeia archaeon]